jgi:hypothetical protein
METGPRTLASRLSEGTMPVEEALHYASLIGESIRQLHDAGKVHGGLAPAAILITAEGVELVPAPEAADGVSPDTAADIAAFGRVLREMLAEENDSPAMERLVAGCLADDPAARVPSMQKALLELKLATLSRRHAGASTARRRDLDAAVGAGIQQAEARQDARIKEYEIRMAEQQQAADTALNALRSEFAGLEARLAATHQSAQSNAARLDALEQNLNSAGRQIALLEARVAGDVYDLKKEIKAQNAVIEMVRASMSQTDDLVGRIVEAVERKLAAADQSAEDSAARLDALEHTVQAASRQNVELDSRLAAVAQRFDKEIEVQTALVENVRTSMAQTDDLVGRVVEAVESILAEWGTARS